MQRIIISVITLAALLTTTAGCSWFPGVHKIEIQQGNLISQEMIDKLKPGMTRNQVRFVLGSPMVADTFHQDRWDYFYSLNQQGEEVENKRVTVYFEDDKLSRIEGDYRPSETNLPAVSTE